MRHSKNKKGGLLSDEQIENGIKNIENKLNLVEKQVNEFKNKNTTRDTTIHRDEGDINQKPWQEDKNIKFKDGTINGRVTLSFPRIILLLDNNITQGNTNKPWQEIKEQLLNAISIQDVENVINKYNIIFSANSIGGKRTRKRRNVKKRRTAKRR
jgi:hypothetical protein